MKKIQYSVALMKNPIHEGDPEKAYANIQQTGVVSLDELAEHITEHNSVFSKGTIVGILTELGVCMRELILQGYKVHLGEIGTFAPAITSEGAESKEKFSAQNIKTMGVNYNPGHAFENLRRDAEFEKTSTRKAQAAALKAENEGKTTADWTAEEEEGEEQEP
jgi:predicted histone-like DNA-binding protein